MVSLSPFLFLTEVWLVWWWFFSFDSYLYMYVSISIFLSGDHHPTTPSERQTQREREREREKLREREREKVTERDRNHNPTTYAPQRDRETTTQPPTHVERRIDHHRTILTWTREQGERERERERKREGEREREREGEAQHGLHLSHQICLPRETRSRTTPLCRHQSHPNAQKPTCSLRFPAVLGRLWRGIPRMVRDFHGGWKAWQRKCAFA